MSAGDNPSKEVTVASADLKSISQFKHEYINMELSILEDGKIKELKLSELNGKLVAILFYEADFTPLIREEIFDMIDMFERFKEKNCQIMACSVDSAQVHEAWQKTRATEEGDGLGRATPFPLIALDILDETTGNARHAMILLNGEGDLVYKDMIDSDVKVNLQTLLKAVEQVPVAPAKQEGQGKVEVAEAQVHPNPPSPPLKSTPEKIQSRLSYAIEEEEEMDELEEAQEIGHDKTDVPTPTAAAVAVEPDKVDAAKPVDQPQATITAPVEAPKEDKTSASVGPQVKTEAKSAPAVPAPTTQASTSSKKKKKGSGSNCCVIT